MGRSQVLGAHSRMDWHSFESGDPRARQLSRLLRLLPLSGTHGARGNLLDDCGCWIGGVRTYNPPPRGELPTRPGHLLDGLRTALQDEARFRQILRGCASVRTSFSGTIVSSGGSPISTTAIIAVVPDARLSAPGAGAAAGHISAVGISKHDNDCLVLSTAPPPRVRVDHVCIFGRRCFRPPFSQHDGDRRERPSLRRPHHPRNYLSVTSLHAYSSDARGLLFGSAMSDSRRGVRDTCSASHQRE